MDFKILKSNDFSTTKWSGGTTTELFIFPKNAEYVKRDFLFRISSATVESEKSVFTALPSYARKLLILDGKITIKHENQYTKELTKFDIDEFDGAWQTSSVGKCVDFNLMTRKNLESKVEVCKISAKNSYEVELEKEYSFLFLYLYSGKFTVELNNKKYCIAKGELLMLNAWDESSLSILALENGEMIISKVKMSSV